jgi:DNA-binding response OmpR family regulator
LAQALRERGLTLPIIGLTAAVVGDDIDRFKAAGADIVMTKPMEMRHLRRMLIDIKQKRATVAVSRLA